MMSHHHRTQLSLVSVLVAVLAGLGAFLLFLKLQFLTSFIPVAWQVLMAFAFLLFLKLQFLTSFIPVAWQVLMAFAFAHTRLSSCPIQLLAEVWPVVQSIATIS
jgi:hypothetical protein